MLKTINRLIGNRLKIAKGWVTIHGRPIFIEDKGEEGEGKGIPQLKNTQEALSYGKKIAKDPDKIKQVTEEHAKVSSATKKLINDLDKTPNPTKEQWSEVSIMALKSQLLRETLEAAEAVRHGKDPEEDIKRIMQELKEGRKGKEK